VYVLQKNVNVELWKILWKVVDFCTMPRREPNCQ